MLDILHSPLGVKAVDHRIIVPPGIQYPVSNIKHQASSIKYQASSIQYQASSIQYQASSIQYPASSIQIMISQLTAPASSLVDNIRQERASTYVQALGIVGFALLTVLGAQARIYIWEVPFTLQTAAVYASGLYLGWRGGLLSQLLYLAIGMFFPVFAGDGYGMAYLFASVSAGYLLGMPLAAMTIGWLSRQWNSLSGSSLSIVAGSLIVFACGVTVLHFAAGHTTWMESIQKGWLRFIPVDLAKILLVSMVYTGTRRLFAGRP